MVIVLLLQRLLCCLRLGLKLSESSDHDASLFRQSLMILDRQYYFWLAGLQPAYYSRILKALGLNIC